VKEIDCGPPAGTSTWAGHAFTSAYSAIVGPADEVSVTDASMRAAGLPARTIACQLIMS
jgi:hypothetical protein